MSAPTAFERVRYCTSDAEEARDFVDQAYGARLKHMPVESDWTVTLDQIQTGPIGTTTLNLPFEFSFDVTGRDEFVFSTLIDGVVGLDAREQTPERYGPGDLYVAVDPQSHCISYTDHCHAHTVTLPADLLAEVAATDPGQPPSPVELLSHQPLPGAGRRWQSVSRFVGDLFADPGAAAAPLVIGSAARLLAATSLSTFPNTAVSTPTIEDRRDAHPDTLRRAVAYIEANPDQDITAADIASAACVTVRAVQIAFRRHLETTPMAYLRRVRLAQARNQLLVADPAERGIIAIVGSRWGFARPSRFAALYRREFGELPSDTLRR